MSEVVKVEVGVSKEAYELGLALAKLVKEGQKIIQDGVQAQDAIALLNIILDKEVMAGIDGLEKIKDEAADNKAAFIAAFVIAATKALE